MSKKAALEEFGGLAHTYFCWKRRRLLLYCMAKHYIIIMHAVRWRHEIYTEDDETR